MRPAVLSIVLLSLAFVPALAVAEQPPAAAPRAAFMPPVPVDDKPAPGSVELPASKAPAVDDARIEAVDSTTEVVKPPRVPEFLGDQAPIGSLRRLPSGQILGQGAVYVPSARYFKISDNGSPRPQTSDTFSFNYFYNLYDDVNARAGGGIQRTRIHREIFGMEWADKEGTMSFGLRLPLNTYNADNTVTGLDGTSTDLGDLTAFWKFRLWSDDATGSLLSAGLAVTPTTATGSFAGSTNLKVFHNTTMQPFFGWIWRHDRFYMQGFTAVDAPTDLNDVVMLENSLGMGFFLYQNERHRDKASYVDYLTAVIPTIELHVSTPLNHRGVLSLADPAGNPDQFNITGGINFEYGDASSVGVAFARPLIGPKMFDFQILFQVRYRY
jgi:hypothetical protein